MPKIRVGNSANAKLNGEYAAHVRKDGKKITAGKRRTKDRKVILQALREDFL